MQPPASPAPAPVAPDGDSFLISEFLSELRSLGVELVARYELLGAVGKGKFATVFKARNLLTNETVALKKVQIFELMNAASREKCLREIKLLEGLQHPNIIRYEAAYIDPNTNELVIVLQWARGGDLKKILKKKRSDRDSFIAQNLPVPPSLYFSEAEIWRFCFELSSGLAYMHSMRVMHRDLKPANILLELSNHVLLGDLGLSRYFTEQTMEAFSKVGTPLYISPEVLTGNGYSFAADIWSLGAILYELCELISPFKPSQPEGVNLFALFSNIKSGNYPPQPRNQRYSDQLIDLISAMMSIQPADRPNLDRVSQFAAQFVPARDRILSRPQSASRPLSAAAVLRHEKIKSPDQQESDHQNTVEASERPQTRGRGDRRDREEPNSQRGGREERGRESSKSRSQRPQSRESSPPPAPVDDRRSNGRVSSASRQTAEAARPPSTPQQQTIFSPSNNHSPGVGDSSNPNNVVLIDSKSRPPRPAAVLLDSQPFAAPAQNPVGRPISATTRPGEPVDFTQYPCDILLEDSIEKLKLLSYESLFCSKFQFPWLRHGFFCQKQAGLAGNFQFVVFAHLIGWLLLHGGNNENSCESLWHLLEDSYHRLEDPDEQYYYTKDLPQRSAILQAALQAMQANQISLGNSIIQADLLNGSGRSVCLLISRLLDHLFKNRLFRPPTFGEKKINKTPLSGLQGTTGESRPSSAMRKNNPGGFSLALPAPVYGGVPGEEKPEEIGNSDSEETEEQEEEQMEEEFDEDNGPQEEAGVRPEVVATAVLDEGARRDWMLEVERMPARSQKVSGPQYIRNAESTAKHIGALSSTLPTFVGDLTKRRGQWSAAAEKIRQAEARLNKEFSSFHEKLREAKENLEGLEKNLEASSQERINYRNTLNDLELRYDALQQKISTSRAGDSDSGLLKLRLSVKQIRKEIEQFDVAIGIKQKMVDFSRGYGK